MTNAKERIDIVNYGRVKAIGPAVPKTATDCTKKLLKLLGHSVQYVSSRMRPCLFWKLSGSQTCMFAETSSISTSKRKTSVSTQPGFFNSPVSDYLYGSLCEIQPSQKTANTEINSKNLQRFSSYAARVSVCSHLDFSTNLIRRANLNF